MNQGRKVSRFTRRQKATQSSHLVSPAKPERAALRPVHAENPILAQRHTLGNQATQRFAASCPVGLPSPGVCPFGGACHACPVQAKLKINEPGDRCEQEADQVAKQVMHMAESTVQRAPTCPLADSPSGSDEKEMMQNTPARGQIKPLIQKQAKSEEELIKPELALGNAGAFAARPIAHDVLHLPGRPLDAETRAFMEPRFGHDFGKVRIHTDAQSVRSAEALDALAYSTGYDIVFGEGRYTPRTTDGKKLLAHELTHVVQQSRIDSSGCLLGQGGKVLIGAIGGSATNLVRRKATPAQRGDANFPPTVFTPGVMHDHKPTGKWKEVQEASSCLRGPIECACANMSPAQVIGVARDVQMSRTSLARRHLNHYLAGGGTDLQVNLEDVIRRDVGVRARLAGVNGSNRGWVRIEQHHYDVEDFQYALGAIDRLDFEVDRAAGLVHVWFKDRYEFHPVGLGYTFFPGDVRRETNCVHAAAVELKSTGASDYWMVGDAIVPLGLFGGPFTYSLGTSERHEKAAEVGLLK